MGPSNELLAIFEASNEIAGGPKGTLCQCRGNLLVDVTCITHTKYARCAIHMDKHANSTEALLTFQMWQATVAGKTKHAAVAAGHSALSSKKTVETD